MRSTGRILSALVVLAVGGYLVFEAASRPSREESKRMATSFCDKVKAGSSFQAALALAREDSTMTAVHVEVDEMVVSFSGGCHCRITFKGGKAFPREPVCAS
jgi:hypothetical protein